LWIDFLKMRLKVGNEVQKRVADVLLISFTVIFEPISIVVRPPVLSKIQRISGRSKVD
jgi:hypothetical protein